MIDLAHLFLPVRHDIFELSKKILFHNIFFNWLNNSGLSFKPAIVFTKPAGIYIVIEPG